MFEHFELANFSIKNAKRENDKFEFKKSVKRGKNSNYTEKPVSYKENEIF